MCDLVLFVSNTQAAGEPAWLVDSASKDYNNGPKVYLEAWERGLMYAGLVCGIIKWILISLRSTNRAVKGGTEITFACVVAQLVFTSIVLGRFSTENRVIPPPSPEGGWIASAAMISAYITVVFACFSIPLHLIDWLWLGCPNRYVSKPKRDMCLSSVLAMSTYLVGAAIYTALEPWNFNDAFFFTIVYLTTIGYGHIVPSTPGSQVFTILYGIVGIAITINYLLSIRAVMIEWMELWVRPSVEDYVRKRRTELQNRKKRKALKTATGTTLPSPSAIGMSNTISSLSSTMGSEIASYIPKSPHGMVERPQATRFDTGVTSDENFQYISKTEGDGHIHYKTKDGLPDVRITMNAAVDQVPTPPLQPTPILAPSSPQTPTAPQLLTSPTGSVRFALPSAAAPTPTDPTPPLQTPPSSRAQAEYDQSGSPILPPINTNVQDSNGPLSPSILVTSPTARPPSPSFGITFVDARVPQRSATTDSMPDIDRIHDYSLANLPPGFVNEASGSLISEGGYAFRRFNTGESRMSRRRSVWGEPEGMEINRRRSMWWVEPRDQLEDEEMIQKWTDRLIALSMVFVFLFYWFVGAAVFDAFEPKWGYIESVYFVWVTLTTVGLGDYVPTTPAAWMWWLYYNLLLISLWAYALMTMGNLLQSQAGVLFQWHATTLPPPVTTDDKDDLDEITDGDVNGHWRTWAAPGAKLHVVSDWFLRVFLFAVLSRCFLVNETVTSPTSASERTTSDGEGGHHAWPTYVEYSQIMSHSLAARLAIRQARGVNRVRFASSVPEYRYQNPAFVPEPDPDNIETKTGKLDIPPPPMDLDKQPSTSGYEGTWRPLYLDTLKPDAPLGDYPRSHIEPHQFRNPLKYKFDQQNRREFGQYVQDEDEILNIWGPTVRQRLWRQNIWLTVAAAGLAAYAALWAAGVNPTGRTNNGAAPPQYPFDGLIRELGGDPDNPEDAYLAAYHHGDTRPSKLVGFTSKYGKEVKV